MELAHIQGVIQLYCRALAGTPIEVSDTTALVQKNIGWVHEDTASTDGTTIFLPPLVQRYPNQHDNFAWFKVVATHQVAHLEFGSFAFTFETPSTMFTDRRGQREQEILVQRQHAFDGLLHQRPLLPLPPGEGRGEGPQRLVKAPHPNPLPLGEGKELIHVVISWFG